MDDTSPWQEYDCPVTGIDIDLNESEIKCVGERFYCLGCGGYHVAGVDGPKYTNWWVDGELLERGLPADAEEKAAWLASANMQASQNNC